LIFEWDEKKNISNKEKHHISFEVAIHIFDDPHRIEFFDFEHSTIEDRYIAIGAFHKILYVVYTERSDMIRIISARLATAREKKIYYDYYLRSK